MKRRETPSWKARALVVIEDMERGIGPQRSLNQLAELIGVSRQTLWRDEELSTRIRLAKVKRKSGRVRVKRRGATEQSAALALEVEQLRTHVERLIEAIVSACERLQGDGIDPMNYFKEPTPPKVDHPRQSKR